MVDPEFPALLGPVAAWKSTTHLVSLGLDVKVSSSANIVDMSKTRGIVVFETARHEITDPLRSYLDVGESAS